MKSNNNHWTKTDFKTYLLLLCAEADSNLDTAEIALIKSKTDPNTFKNIFNQFKEDTEDEGLAKIQENIHSHDYSHLELTQLKKEIHEVFFSDSKLSRMEENLNKILDNILY